MSTLVTSVTPLIIPQPQTLSTTTKDSSCLNATIDAENTENAVNSASEAVANSNFSNNTSQMTSSLNLSPQQQQKHVQQQQQHQIQQMLPAQLTAVTYSNGTAGFNYATNYVRTLQPQQQQQAQQLPQQLHTAFNAAVFQQQQQQLAATGMPNIVYHHQQNHFSQLQTQTQQQRCTLTPTSTTPSSSLIVHQQQPSALPLTTLPTGATSNSINRSQRCGVCRGCQCKPCGVCTYCQDSPQFGGRGVKKQSCIERRCLRVLENRLQRDTPNFKARMGCNNCEDCRMPDCQVCLVCLDRRFFNNRYMNGAICGKKRCNNAVSLELSPQTTALNNNDLPPSTDKNQANLKRSYDSTNYEQMSTKRPHQVVHKNTRKSMTPPTSNGSQHTVAKNVTSPNGIMVDVLPRQHLLQQQLAVQQFKNMQKGNDDIIPIDAYRNGTTVVTTNSDSSIDSTTQLVPNNSYYFNSAGYPYSNTATVNGGAVSFDPTTGIPATNNLVYQHYQQQQQHLQTQMFCNTYIQQQQKFANYPKYEYYDEHVAYGAVMQNAMQNATQPPSDPFVPPSYSEMKNAVVLQPL